MSNEDLSVDYELAQRQCAQLHSEGSASLDASIAATEAWADQQTTERWGTESGAIAFRLAYRDFLDRFVAHLRGNKMELEEFTSRLQGALRRFQNNEEELQKVVGGIVAEIEAKSREGKYTPSAMPNDMFGQSMPPNMRME